MINKLSSYAYAVDVQKHNVILQRSFSALTNILHTENRLRKDKW